MMKLSFAGASIAEINGSIIAYAAALQTGNPPAPTASTSTASSSAPAAPTAAASAPTAAPADGSAEVDAAGVAWDPAKHAGTKAKVASGLWRMKVGVKRAEGEGEDSPSYVKPGAGSAPAAAPSNSPPPPVPTSVPAVDPNRPTDAAFRHDNGDGTEQWHVNGAWDGGKHAIPAAAPPPPPAADPDDEFAQFATAAAAPAAPTARNWTDADLSKLCNQGAVKDGNPDRVKVIIAKYLPEGEAVQHSRNIPADKREAFAQDVETTLGIQYAG